jgi:hypothetical protein
MNCRRPGLRSTSLLLLLLLLPDTHCCCRADAAEHYRDNADDGVMRWEQFKTTHGRHYSASENARRRAIFRDNLRYIERENARPGRTYWLGVTEFADWTHEEWVAMLQPSPPPPLPAAGNVDQSLSEHKGAIPAAVDWVAAGAVTGVKNQGSCGVSRGVVLARSRADMLTPEYHRLIESVMCARGSLAGRSRRWGPSKV